MPLRLTLTSWFGAMGRRPLPASLDPRQIKPEQYCPEDASGWREAHKIDGVDVSVSAACVANNPYAVAAFVKGTNNVSNNTLMASELTADAVEKGQDLDGDGDPDEIHIRFEVVELNGGSALSPNPVTQFQIAPGSPGLWVFAPKLVGIAVENF